MKQLICLVLLFISTGGNSSHIIGGVAHYNFVSVDTVNATTILEITFRMYRDPHSGGAAFDANATFGVYVKNIDGEYDWFESLRNIGHESISMIEFEIGTEIFAIQHTDYSFQISLPHGKDYIISYQRCCRLPDLQNLLYPAESGIALQLEILNEGLISGLNSPEIVGIPFSGEIINKDFSYEMEILKPDNTQASFQFVAPKESGGIFDANMGTIGCCECIRPEPQLCPPPFDEVLFSPEYSSENLFGNLNSLDIDNQTGEIIGICEQDGKYNYGIEIVQILDGKILSKQLLDYTLFIIRPTSVEDLSTENSVRLVPNPSNGKIQIKLADSTSADNIQVELFQLDGRRIKTINVEEKSHTIDFGVTSGIYIVKLLSNNKLLGVQKLVVH